jgi:hypothetical protein
MATVISIPKPADFHVHLRQGDLSALVTPHVRKGGFHLAYVMVLFFSRPDKLVLKDFEAEFETTDLNGISGPRLQICP